MLIFCSSKLSFLERNANANVSLRTRMNVAMLYALYMN